jgi:hypothetical protein
LKAAYIRLVDDLLAFYARDPSGFPRGLAKASFAERFAACLGFSQGELLHHVDPVLCIFQPGFRWRPDLPDPRVPELFRLIRHPALVDRIEELIGPRITASPVIHFNIKLALEHLKLAREIAGSRGSGVRKKAFQGVNLAKTHWHMDAIACLKDSHASRIVNAWVPLTSATEDNACLRVVPGSHLAGVRYPPYPRDLDRRSVTLPVEPGDVVFLDNMTLHCSTGNVSRSDYRAAFNFRYVATGQPTGRPFLPEFVVRDRDEPANEMTDAATWARMWRGCLAYISRNGVPVSFEDVGRLSAGEAARITREWRQRVPDPEAWAQLEEQY